MSKHLAELNVGYFRYPTSDPRMAEFMDNLDRVNALAERSPGFVWRLAGDNNNATEFRIEELDIFLRYFRRQRDIVTRCNKSLSCFRGWCDCLRFSQQVVGSRGKILDNILTVLGHSGRNAMRSINEIVLVDKIHPQAEIL